MLLLKLLIAGFEPGSSGVGSDCSVTTAVLTNFDTFDSAAFTNIILSLNPSFAHWSN